MDLTESTIEANKRFFDNNVDLVPKQAYTMGIKTIMQARKVLMVANGANKAEIIKKAFFGPVTPRCRPPSCRCTPTSSWWATRRLWLWSKGASPFPPCGGKRGPRARN